jgi:glycosyltransferase involved in cell wall biosynthesis
VKNVLIFAHQCAPFNRPESTIGAQRPAQFAKFLPDFGWRAIVLCCENEHYRQPATASIDERVHQAIDGLPDDRSVIIPVPPLRWDGLVDRLWRWLLPPRGDSEDRYAFARKPLTLIKLMTGDYSQSWQPPARRAAEFLASRIPIDVCIGEHSPDAGLFLARWFMRRYGVPWVADFRDPILRPYRGLARKMYVPVARNLLSTASHIVNVTPSWSEVDARLFDKPSETVPNGFDASEYAPISPRRDSRLTVAYFGNVHEGMQPRIFLDGVQLLRQGYGDDLDSVFRFLYRGNKDDAMRSEARAAGVSDLVDCGPPIPRSEALAEMRKADALLLLSLSIESSEELAHGVYPGKTFEYFGAQRPILCVPGDGGQLDELIGRTRTGYVLRSAGEVAEFLRALLKQEEIERELAYRPDHFEVCRYSRKSLAGQLALVLDKAMLTGTGTGGSVEPAAAAVTS